MEEIADLKKDLAQIKQQNSKYSGEIFIIFIINI